MGSMYTRPSTSTRNGRDLSLIHETYDISAVVPESGRPLAAFIAELNEIMRLHGGDATVEFSAGYENITAELFKTRKETPEEKAERLAQEKADAARKAKRAEKKKTAAVRGRARKMAELEKLAKELGVKISLDTPK
jgi:hypothetical protein